MSPFSPGVQAGSVTAWTRRLNVAGRTSPVEYNRQMPQIYPATLLFNFAMLVVVAFAVRSMNRRRGFFSWWGAMSLAGFAAVTLGGVMGLMFEDPFGIVRLWTYGLFLHGTILFAATAVVWRMKFTVAFAAAAVVLLMLSVAAYAFLVEPYRLETTHYRIASRKITRPVRIVVVADPQTDRIGPYERETLSRAIAEKPDLILFAGDYCQTSPDKQESLQRDYHRLLREIHVAAPLGAFAVRGNVDPPGWPEIFEGTGVTPVDRNWSIDLGELRLTCLKLGTSRETSPRVYKATEDRFHVVLGHIPNFALGARGADLLIAGHTHGGQVRLPLLGAIIVNCRVPRRWASGLNDLPGGGKLFVSRGIGLERNFAPRLRFLCRPELAVIDLVPEEEGTTDDEK